LTAGTGPGFNPSRYIVPVLALAALAAFSILIPAAAHAQESERIGLLNRLFGQREVQRVEPAPVVKRPVAQERKRKKRPARAPVEGAAAPQAAEVSKRSDARAVLVIGDFLAGGLAEGLTTALTENAGVKVVDRSSGSSGFVRLDFHNWATEIDRLITSERPAAVIVMIGANDRQQMTIDGEREAVRSEAWNKEYAKRAGEFAKAVTARKVPLLWVGAPPFKSSKMMLDMLAFNEVYRAAATAAGGEYVDIWDGFVDENGAYIANGPDLNGQPARLRANDGINLARPGKRKIAFFAEKPLYKVLGGDLAAAGAAVASAIRPAFRMYGPFGPSELPEPADLDVVVDPNEVGPIDPARPVALRTPGLDGGVELLGAVTTTRTESQTPAERLVVEGFAPAPPLGRADQSSWPQVASLAAAMRQVNIDRTTNKTPAPSAPVPAAIDRAAIRTVRANELTEPPKQAPPRAATEAQEDRLEEISPPQAAPDVAAPEPPMAAPPTLDRDAVPNYAAGDPLDRAPLRGAPERSFKRPTSIGPEPNRAPTAVPLPPVEEIAPAETEIPVATAPADATATPAETTEADAGPALPDSAPARAPVPSLLPVEEPGVTSDNAPARAAPRKAEPVPVAALPSDKDVLSELPQTPVAPVSIAPNAPVEAAADTAAPNAAPAELDTVDGKAPARAAPVAAASAPVEPAVRTVPSILPAVPDVPVSGEQAGQPTGQSGDQPAPVAEPATPPAPAAPSTIAKNPADAPDTGEEPAQTATPIVPHNTTPPAPAAPTALPENAAKPAPAPPGRRADIGDSAPDNAAPDTADGADVSPIRSISAASRPAIIHP
jgi:hypothetical protein